MQTADIAVNRGYLANAEEVQVKGFEVDARVRLDKVTLQASYAYTDGKYVKFTNAPLPLEQVGAPVAFIDISGGLLPGISKNAFSFTGEYARPITLLGTSGEVFGGFDAYYRSDFSSSASPSYFSRPSTTSSDP